MPLFRLLIIVFARPVFVFAAHVITAGIFLLSGDETPFRSSGPYWSVYGTMADIACLLLLGVYVKKEGIRLIDLFSFSKKKLPGDLLLALAILTAGGLIMILIGRNMASLLAYGNLNPNLPEGSFIRYLPVWAVLYSRLIWWVIWSPTEELIYNGYSLPRLELALGSKWKALLIVSFSWALMHSFLPLINLQHALFMFIMFFPLSFFFGWVYLRIRRLMPLVFAHWLMDLGNVFFMTRFLS